MSAHGSRLHCIGQAGKIIALAPPWSACGETELGGSLGDSSPADPVPAPAQTSPLKTGGPTVLLQKLRRSLREVRENHACPCAANRRECFHHGTLLVEP